MLKLASQVKGGRCRIIVTSSQEWRKELSGRRFGGDGNKGGGDDDDTYTDTD